MRSGIAALAVAAIMSVSVMSVSVMSVSVMSVSVAHAENRMFIIANLANDGYGVDDCLSSGAECGKAVANSYCRSHDYSQAVSFRNVDRGDITGAIPASASGSCKGASCDHLVAIECTR
jgi:hypothetical protein